VMISAVCDPDRVDQSVGVSPAGPPVPPAPVPVLRTVKRAEVLARDIVEEIVAGDLRPGDLLASEALMLEHYQVGRASLREALRLLETQGVVSMKPGPGGGPVVGGVDPANLGRTATLYLRMAGATCGVLAEAMVVFEPWLAELAAVRAERAEVEKSLGACMEAADRASGDPEGVWRTAPQFHDAVYHLSGNAVLETLACALGAIFRSQVLSRVELRARQPEFLADHHRIAAAIADGRPQKARRLALAHIQAIVGEVAGQAPELYDEVIVWQ